MGVQATSAKRKLAGLPCVPDAQLFPLCVGILLQEGLPVLQMRKCWSYVTAEMDQLVQENKVGFKDLTFWSTPGGVAMLVMDGVKLRMLA